MANVTVQFIGTGDVLGSGGRGHTCFSVRAGDSHLLIDCGASAVPAMQRFGVDPSSVDAVVLSHLHGDHFGGIPFLVLHGQFNAREKPLLVAGPQTVRERVTAAMEVLFPGMSAGERRFTTSYQELSAAIPARVGPARVTAYEVVHPSGAPAHALRIEIEGKVIAYSGDGEWSESHVAVADGADLFVCEAYTVERVVKNHLSYGEIRAHREELRCKRLYLTHMSPDLLNRLDSIVPPDAPAEDGQIVEV
jgi:ribonuclease BN (tRNA processing enzyme)